MKYFETFVTKLNIFQPSVIPMNLIPAENIPQNYTVNGHYIMPQNVPIINTNAPEAQRRHFMPESNFVPYYIAQPQVRCF